MTAIVSILNKRAVAIAADSAVTFGHKVVNSGNKIFTLSKYHPIAIMTYNNASYMGIPWDTLIKVYRQRLGDKELDTVEEYVENFLDYLHDPSLYLQSECIESLTSHLFAFYRLLINLSKQEIKDFDENAADAYNKLKVTSEKYRDIYNKARKNIEFADYKYDDFLVEAKQSIVKFWKSKKNPEMPESELDGFLKTFYEYLLSDLIYNDYTGIAITGYGAKELFPSLVQVLISTKINQRLRYYMIQPYHIGNGESDARIIPFAQINIEQTIVRGIHPDIRALILSSFKKIMEDLAKSVPALTPDVYTNMFEDEITNYIQEHHTGPLMDTIIHLDKEDMADMAESIVYLTSLMKKISPEEETVGGPVDVAVISKGDGFVWMKRKHYFSPDLNPHFVSNYFYKHGDNE